MAEVPDYQLELPVEVKAQQTLVLKLQARDADSIPSQPLGERILEIHLVDEEGQPLRESKQVYLRWPDGRKPGAVQARPTLGLCAAVIENALSGTYQLSLREILPTTRRVGPEVISPYVYFNTDDDNPRPIENIQEAIDNARKALEDGKAERFELKCFGYADNRGSRIYNQDLSSRRARAVQKLLEDAVGRTSERRPPVLVSAQGLGEINANDDGASGQDNAEHRRVEIHLFKDLVEDPALPTFEVGQELIHVCKVIVKEDGRIVQSAESPKCRGLRVASTEWNGEQEGNQPRPGVERVSLKSPPPESSREILGVAVGRKSLNGSRGPLIGLEVRLDGAFVHDKRRRIEMVFDGWVQGGNNLPSLSLRLLFAKKGLDTYAYEFSLADWNELSKSVGPTPAGQPRINAHFFRVSAALNPGELVRWSTNRAYPVLQRLLFFVPGVLGSRLSVNKDGAPIECYPEVDIPKREPKLALLFCLETGVADAPAVPGKLEVLHWVYDDRPELYLKVEGLPEVYLTRSGSERLKHFLYEELPYDWRLNLDEEDFKRTARELVERDSSLLVQAPRFEELGAEEKPYPFLASLSRRILARIVERQAHNPFVADDVALAGHSTGGLLVRGLVSVENPVKQRVDKAFFINVPFWGAPKAEYVLFTGNMLDCVQAAIENEQVFRMIGVDMPIIYFLCSGHRYGEEVDEPWAPEDRKARYERLVPKEWLERKYYLDAVGWHGRGAGGGDWATLSGGRLPFNARLAELSEEYCRALEKSKPEVETIVFHSLSAQEDTQVCVRTRNGEPNPVKAPVGDGTVPLVSQIADLPLWKNATFRFIPGYPSHMAAGDDEQVWKEIGESLCGLQPPGVGIGDLKSYLMASVQQLAERGGSNDIKETREPGTLREGNRARELKHTYVKSGVARIGCLSGRLKVSCVAFDVFSSGGPELYPEDWWDLTAGSDVIVGFERPLVLPHTHRITLSLAEGEVEAKYNIHFLSW